MYTYIYFIFFFYLAYLVTVIILLCVIFFLLFSHTNSIEKKNVFFFQSLIVLTLTNDSHEMRIKKTTKARNLNGLQNKINSTVSSFNGSHITNIKSFGSNTIILMISFFLNSEMNSQRLAKVTEAEETSENEGDDDPLQNNNKKNSNRVTINPKAEEMDREENSSQPSNGTSRRPSVLIQEILSTRRPSAIMAAIRSPKQFVNRYRRE